MSRSRPTDNNTPNPAQRWFEWNGEQGIVFYYDKEQKKKIDVGSDFDFILLDELASVRGWHKKSGSSIYSNEVRDTRQDAFVVKAFKKDDGVIASGLYRTIADDIKAAGGHFATNLYIAFKLGPQLALGSIRLKGSALSAWLEFRKAHRGDVYKQAIKIHGFVEDKTGRVTFRKPVFELKKLSETSDAAALALDNELQAYLTGYLARTTHDQVAATATRAEQQTDEPVPTEAAAEADFDAEDVPDINDDDIPF